MLSWWENHTLSQDEVILEFTGISEESENNDYEIEMVETALGKCYTIQVRRGII